MNRITKAELFRKLHAGPEPLLLPNAWDAASARLIAAEGYPAIASSSGACAGVLGYPDGQRIPRGEMLSVCRNARAVAVVLLRRWRSHDRKGPYLRAIRGGA